MEELTPELERRLQVEEAWARRIVLADMLNERRLAAYGTRRMFLRFQAADFSANSNAAPQKTPGAQPDFTVQKNIVPARLSAEEWNSEPRAAGRISYWAGAIAAAAVILLGTATLSGQISWAELAATYRPHDLLEQQGPGPAEILAKTGTDLPPGAKTESSTLTESDDQAEQVTSPQARNAGRPDLREEVRLRIEAVQQAADRAGEHAEQQVPSEATGASAGR